MTSVIFNGKREHIGKIVKVKITNSNRNTLFGELLSNFRSKGGINLNNSTIKKNFDTTLKFVYSDNNSLSVIFHDNELLNGCCW